jgi:putative sigma-54 modulation protein
MVWTIKKGRGRVPPELVEHVDRRLHFALARFGPRIARATVALEDVNGPRGGVDKACRIVVRLRSGGDVVASVDDVDWHAAVDRATTRIGQSVAREVVRTREVRGLPAATPRGAPVRPFRGR